jgi:curved DNA-binding protein CbpA
MNVAHSLARFLFPSPSARIPTPQMALAVRGWRLGGAPLLCAIAVLCLWPSAVWSADSPPVDRIDVTNTALWQHFNHYQFMECSSSIAQADLKRAYKTIALKYHPDKYTNATERAAADKYFAQIVNAYETLKDVHARARYDSDLRAGTADHTPHFEGGKSPRELYEEEMAEAELHLVLGALCVVLCVALPFVSGPSRRLWRWISRRTGWGAGAGSSAAADDPYANAGRAKTTAEREAERAAAEAARAQEEARRAAAEAKRSADAAAEAEAERSAKAAEAAAKQRATALRTRLRQKWRALCTVLLTDSTAAGAPADSAADDSKDSGSGVSESGSDLSEAQSLESTLSFADLLALYVRTVRPLADDRPFAAKAALTCTGADCEAARDSDPNSFAPLIAAADELKKWHRSAAAATPAAAAVGPMAEARKVVMAAVELRRADRERERKQSAERSAAAAAAAAASSSSSWSAEELSLLARAIARYPGGSDRRWEKVAKAVGNGRTEREVIAKCKELDLKAIAAKGGPPTIPTGVAGGGASTGATVATGAEGKAKAAPAATAAKSMAELSAAAGDWSAAQQTALEAALRYFCSDA